MESFEPTLEEEFIADVSKFLVKNNKDAILKEYFRFFRYMWDTICTDKYVHNWTNKFLCDEAQIVCERIFKRLPKLYDLIINVPPGQTKTLNYSQLLNAWMWTRDPGLRFLGSSNRYELSLFNAMQTKTCLTSSKYVEMFGPMHLKDDMQAKGHFMNLSKGERNATSVGSNIIGFHYHIIVPDDLIDAKEIITSAKIEGSQAHIRQLLSRKTDLRLTPVIYIGQRVAFNDPTSYLVSKLRKVRHIILPSEDKYPINPPELRQFYKDGLLNPKRLPRDILETQYEELGPTGYDAQYGQQPVNEHGKTLKKDNFVFINKQDLDQNIFTIQKNIAADTAYTANKKNDPSGLLVFVYYKNILYLFDFYEVWLESPDVIRKIKEVSSFHNVNRVHIENKASGMSIASAARTQGINAIDFPVLNAEKEARLMQYLAMFEAKRVYIVKTADNEKRMEVFMNRILAFPTRGVHDEAIDTLSMALKIVNTQTINRKWK